MKCKLPLYVAVRIIKYLPEHQSLFEDETKQDGVTTNGEHQAYLKAQPYHPYANEDSDLPPGLE